MFERFTERARQVVVLAQEEARILKHSYIGTEHILLGLMREEEGLAARVLESLDITVERVRAQVVRIVGSGEEVTSGQIPFTPRAKQVLELALREALSLNHNYIGTEHILLGLARENQGVAARILLDFDADSEKIRDEVIRMLSGPGGRRSDRRYTLIGAKPHEPLPLSHVEADDGASRLIDAVAPEIEQHLDRSADAGDLLVALASMSDGLAARTLTALGVDSETLTRASDQARREPTPVKLLELLELDGELEKLREQQAANAETAAALRDSERQLVKKARELDESRLSHALIELRDRLELPYAQP